MHRELTDTELITSLHKNEDVAAFVEIYNRYWDKLFNAAYKRIKNTESCEEIVQEVFTTFWIKHDEICINTGLSNYLYTAVRNKVIDYYRKQLVRTNFSLNVVHKDYDNSSEQSLILKELHEQIELSINQLPEKCKSVYLLSRMDYHSNKEIASQLNISEKTVEGHLTKALKHLRVSLSDFLILLLFIHLV
jgi:RNA polymerase sigma-70 factor (ECF subfamily)